MVVVAQQDGSVEDPKEQDLYSYGTLALVLKTFDMPDNSKSAIVQGVDRVKILKYEEGNDYFIADVRKNSRINYYSRCAGWSIWLKV